MSHEEPITDEPDADNEDEKEDEGIPIEKYLKEDDEENLIENFPQITDTDFQIPKEEFIEQPKNENDEIPLEDYLEPEDEEGLIDSFPQITDADRQIIEYKDAVSESAKILAPQLGSDKAMLEKGMVDIRRLTNIDKIERLWLSFFMQLPKDQGGEWMDLFCTDYMNLSPSIGGMRAKLIIAMQSAIGGTRQQRGKAKDDRSFIEKHFTRRNQQPEDVLDVGV